MRSLPEVLLIHARGAPWHDLVGALNSIPLNVQTASSPEQAELCMRNQSPDVVLLDGNFEHGIDLLLKTRQTASGILIVVVCKSRRGAGLYDAMFPGESPRYVEPTHPETLAALLRDSLIPSRSPPPPPAEQSGMAYPP